MPANIDQLLSEGLAKAEAFGSIVPERPLAIVRTHNHIGGDRYEEVFDVVGLDDAGSPCWQIADFGATTHPSNEAAAELMKFFGTHGLALLRELARIREAAKAAEQYYQLEVRDEVDGWSRLSERVAVCDPKEWFEAAKAHMADVDIRLLRVTKEVIHERRCAADVLGVDNGH